MIEDPLPLNWKEILGIQVSKHGQTLVGLHAGMAAKLQLYFHYPPTKMQRFLRQKRRPRSTLALARPVMVTPTEIRYFHVPPQRAQFSQKSVSVSEIRGGKTHHWILLANVSTKKHWCYHIPNSLPKKKKILITASRWSWLLSSLCVFDFMPLQASFSALCPPAKGVHGTPKAKEPSTWSLGNQVVDVTCEKGV